MVIFIELFESFLLLICQFRSVAFRFFIFEIFQLQNYTVMKINCFLLCWNLSDLAKLLTTNNKVIIECWRQPRKLLIFITKLNPLAAVPISAAGQNFWDLCLSFTKFTFIFSIWKSTCLLPRHAKYHLIPITNQLSLRFTNISSKQQPKVYWQKPYLVWTDLIVDGDGNASILPHSQF